jgi:phosphoribosyl-ATP pyrophosphohydrolase
MQNDDIIQSLYKVILDRKANPSENSYTASLMAKGIDKILKKVGEEASELLIAGKGGGTSGDRP